MKSKNFIMGNDILSVSKSVALYQKHVHIKNCLAAGYIPRAGRQVKMMFIPVPEASYTQAKAYCPISFLSFIQKTMQKLVARNIRNESLGHVPYIYNNLPTNQGSTETAMHHVLTYIQKKAENRKITLEFS